MRYLALDGCAVSRPMYGPLRKIKRKAGFSDSTAVYNSIARNDDPKVVAILHAHGKHTQQEVINLHAAGVPGYGPANSVETTTHCCGNDGVAFPGAPIGVPGPWWFQGFDVNDAYVDDIEAAAKALGWDVHRPYSSGSEYHHLNFVRKPTRWRLIYKAIFGKKKKSHKH